MDAQALVQHNEARELAPRADDKLSNLQRLGKLLAASGYFSDAREMAQAAVKVMAGEELGIPPIASMMGVNIIQGKVALGANLIASRIRAHGYEYHVKRLDDTGCVVEFSRGGQTVGESSFVEADAKAAGLLGKPGPWKNYPRNMYFARAISNGARWYAPEIFGGAPVYTPEELGADVDRDGEVVHRTPTEQPIDTGGHPGNTREAQAVVRDRKLAELRIPVSKPAQAGSTAAPRTAGGGGNGAHAPAGVSADLAKLWSLMTDLKGVFAVFAELKKQIIQATGSDAAYYRLLGEYGWNNAQDAKGKGRQEVRKLARMLWEYVEKCKAATAEPPKQDPHEITDDDVPAVLGGTWTGEVP